tara:strand:+ start:3082 stop:4872 length:1791 start_codon:yes stop_codon:yes gene_type:complete
MDNLIKYPSQQSTFNVINNLVDLIVPGASGVYSLAESYITLDVGLVGVALDITSATAGQLPTTGGLEIDTAVADMRLKMKHNAGVNETIYDECATPVELLVRNCSLRSQSKGVIEDLRRSDILRATMKSYTQDMNDVQGRALVGVAGMAKESGWASGAFADLRGVGDVMSTEVRHEIRIYLKDLFNFCQADEYDSEVYGDLRIHLELNLDRVRLVQNMTAKTGTYVSGEEVWGKVVYNKWNGSDVGQAYTYGNVKTQYLSNGAGVPETNFLEMAAQYQSLDDSPFWVGQALITETTIAIGATGVIAAPAAYPATGEKRWGVVTSIAWDKTTKLITLGFGGKVLECGAITGLTGTNIVQITTNIIGAPVTAASLEITPAGGSNLVYENCEITMVMRNDMQSGPPQTQYTQYLNQADQFSSATSLNRSYFLPAQTTNCIICLPNADGTQYNGESIGSDLLGSARLTDYRFTINGESVTNRAVDYMSHANVLGNNGANLKGLAGSSQHYDLITKTFLNQGNRFHSLQECVYSQVIPTSTKHPGAIGWTSLGDNPQRRVYMLALPIPTSNDQTQLTIELEGHFPAGSGALQIYSEVRSVI